MLKTFLPPPPYTFLPLSPSCHTLLAPSSSILQMTDLPTALNDTPDLAYSDQKWLLCICILKNALIFFNNTQYYSC
jgi:hypothetical protein